MKITVVIPTYNRKERILPTLESIRNGECAEIEGIEVIVVDDGSASPIESFVQRVKLSAFFDVKVVRQENQGPAAARNHGFRRATGEIVLFLDDDIICAPDLVHRHVEAHRLHPGSVVFGRWHILRPPVMNAVYRHLYGEDWVPNDPPYEIEPTEAIASGHLSVERMMFADMQVYRSDLRTPAAEEYELAARMKARGIPVLFAKHIVAWHDFPPTVEAFCSQAYKHASGLVEAWIKCPNVRDLPDVRRMILRNGCPAGDGRKFGLSSVPRRLLGTPAVRSVLRVLTQMLEKAPISTAFPSMFNLSRSAYFFGGYFDGWKRFSRTEEPNGPLTRSDAPFWKPTGNLSQEKRASNA